ncbi:KilA-N domain-containing protein [Escherichia coli]|nr:KilA-N domain-containing protein [Escherichia coli]
MNNLMVIDGIEVRRDAYGRYSLNDLHRAAGSLDKHKPAFWLRNEQTERLISELQICNSVNIEPVNVIRGGNNQGTYVCKELVYAYAMWMLTLFVAEITRDVCLQRTGVCLCNVDQPVIPSEGDPYFRHGNQRTGKIIRTGC